MTSQLASSRGRGGGATEKRAKKRKKRPKNSTFLPLSTIFVPCLNIQGRTCPPPLPTPMITIDFLKFDFVVTSLKKQNLATSPNFRSPKPKIKRCWGRRASIQHLAIFENGNHPTRKRRYQKKDTATKRYTLKHTQRRKLLSSNLKRTHGFLQLGAFNKF